MLKSELVKLSDEQLWGAWRATHSAAEQIDDLLTLIEDVMAARGLHPYGGDRTAGNINNNE